MRDLFLIDECVQEMDDVVVKIIGFIVQSPQNAARVLNRGTATESSLLWLGKILTNESLFSVTVITCCYPLFGGLALKIARPFWV